MPKKQRVKYKKLTYAELQAKLLKMADSYGIDFPSLEDLFLQCREMQRKLYETIQTTAAFHDKEANEILLKQGVYTAYDEPHAVQRARETLQEL